MNLTQILCMFCADPDPLPIEFDEGLFFICKECVGKAEAQLVLCFTPNGNEVSGIELALVFPEDFTLSLGVFPELKKAQIALVRIYQQLTSHEVNLKVDLPSRSLPK